MMDNQETITVHVKGIAASIAHVLSQAADKVIMTDYSMRMMHNPSNAGGDSAVLEKFKNALVTIYSKRTGLDEGKISDMMDATTWFNAEQALEMGFCDEIQNTKQRAQEIKNEMDPMDLFSIVNQLEVEPKPKLMKNVLNHLSLDSKTEETTILKAIEEIEGQWKAETIKKEGMITEVASKEAAIEELQNKLDT